MDIITKLAASIENEMAEYPANIRQARERFNALRDVLYITQRVMSDGGSPEVVALLVESAIRQSFRLADALSGLARLEMTASDFGVAMALMRSEVEESEVDKTPVKVYELKESA
jgi:hypothetical protein